MSDSPVPPAMTWEYRHLPFPSRHGFYVFLVHTAPLQYVWETSYLSVPQTPENDADVQSIVESFNRLAERITGEWKPILAPGRLF